MTYEHKEYASKGVANTGLGLGIAGTAIGLMAANGNGGCGCGNNGGLLGGLFGGNDHCECYETKECANLRTALAIAESEKFTTEQTKTDMERLYVEIRREDEKITSQITDVVNGVVAMGNQIGELKGDIKGLTYQVERNREESARNFAEGKNYTETRVDALSAQAKCEIEKVYLWTQAQNYVPAVLRVDPNQICGASPIATPCGACGTCGL